MYKMLSFYFNEVIDTPDGLVSNHRAWKLHQL